MEQNSTSDVQEALDARDVFNQGFVLWHYDQLFENPSRYDKHRLVAALGGDESDFVTQVRRASTWQRTGLAPS